MLLSMKKIDNFSNSLRILKKADFEKVHQDEIYRTGVIGQFSLTFELAWKALQEMLIRYGVLFTLGSPREVLKAAYKCSFIDDEKTWLLMLNKRNISTHIYSEEKIDDMLVLIQEKFIFAFTELENKLREKYISRDE